MDPEQGYFITVGTVEQQVLLIFIHAVQLAELGVCSQRASEAHIAIDHQFHFTVPDFVDLRVVIRSVYRCDRHNSSLREPYLPDGHVILIIKNARLIRCPVIQPDL